MKTLRRVYQHKKILAFFFLMLGVTNTTFAVHVYEVVEVSFTAKEKYDNPYMDVNFDVTLKGPGDITYQVPAFWDGGNIWRARLVATNTGTWNWSTGNSQTRDSGLNNKKGSFEAIHGSIPGISNKQIESGSTCRTMAVGRVNAN